MAEEKTLKETEAYDCIVIGGGPAGLTASIYLARFLHNVLTIDDNNSRAALIPISHNYPGMPEGISGIELLARMRQQLANFHGKTVKSTVTHVDQDPLTSYFKVNTGSSTFKSRFIILATGVVDVEPVLPNVENAIKRGLIRHCPICDGYEVQQQKIGVIARSKKGLAEALFLSTYSSDITLITLGKAWTFDSEEQNNIEKLKIKIVSEMLSKIEIVANKITSICTVSGKVYYFDTLYSALGACLRTDMIKGLKTAVTDEGYLLVDDHQQTTVSGLYAIGDIVSSLNQICVATGQAAIAATAIHNRLNHF